MKKTTGERNSDVSVLLEEGLNGPQENPSRSRFDCVCCCRRGHQYNKEGRHEEYSAAAARKRLFRLANLANLLFLVGAALQVCGSHLDLRWIRNVQHIPVNVLQAKDDATWMAYQRRNRYVKQGRKLQDASKTTVKEFAKPDGYSLSQRENVLGEYTSALAPLKHNATTWNRSTSDDARTNFTAEQQTKTNSLGHDEKQLESVELEDRSEISAEKTYEDGDSEFDSNSSDDESNEIQSANNANLARSADLYVTSTSTVLGAWREIPWVQIPSHIQSAFQILGYNEELWDSEGTAFSEHLHWNELTSYQRSQAELIGFNEQDWNDARGVSIETTSPESQQQAVQAIIPVVAAPTSAPRAPTSTAAPTKAPTSNEKFDIQAYSAVYLSKDDYLEQESLMPLGIMGIPIWYVLSALASLFFVAVGAINWVREEQVFHIWLIQGSVCMILNAVCLNFSETGSIIFQTLGYHCFLIEGAYLLRLRKAIRPLDGLETMSYALWGADFMFGSSSLVSVLLSYWKYFDADAEYNLNVGYGGVFTSWLWMFTSIIYGLCTLVLSKKNVERYID